MKLLTTQQLAAKLGVSDARIRRLTIDGRIKPLVRLPNGQPLFSARAKMPKAGKPGPKPKPRKGAKR